MAGPKHVALRLLALVWQWTVGWLLVSVAAVGLMVTAAIDLLLGLASRELSWRPFVPAFTWTYEQHLYGFTGEGQFDLLPYV